MRRKLISIRSVIVVASLIPAALLPSCGEDEPTAPNDALPDGSAAEASSSGDSASDSAPGADGAAPGTISVHLDAPRTAIGFAVFYPKNDVANPIVEPIAHGQTVTKELPDGAHVIVASIFENGSYAFVDERDDVPAGDALEIDDPPSASAGPPLPVSRTVPVYTGATDDVFVYASCFGSERVAAGNSLGSFDSRCVEPGNKARFLAFAYDNARTLLALGTSVVDVPTDGGTTFAPIDAWSAPAPTTWSVTGTPPGGEFEYGFFVAATNTGTAGGFPLASDGLTAPQVPAFSRPPAGFNDGELHSLGVAYAANNGAGSSLGSRAMLVDRTASNAVLASDLSALPPHFTRAFVDGTPAPSPTIDYVTSAPFGAGTTLRAMARGVSAGDGGATNFVWYVTTASSSARLAGLPLPPTVRDAVMGASATWSVGRITAVSGVDQADLRQRASKRFYALHEVTAFGLPPGNFQAKVARIERSSD